MGRYADDGRAQLTEQKEIQWSMMCFVCVYTHHRTGEDQIRVDTLDAADTASAAPSPPLPRWGEGPDVLVVGEAAHS